MSDQKSINDAVDYLYTHGRKYAEAKAHRVYHEEYRKSQKIGRNCAAQNQRGYHKNKAQGRAEAAGGQGAGEGGEHSLLLLHKR